MFALVKDNKIEKIFTRPVGIMIDNNQYPREVFTLWTDEERKNIWKHYSISIYLRYSWTRSRVIQRNEYK